MVVITTPSLPFVEQSMLALAKEKSTIAKN